MPPRNTDNIAQRLAGAITRTMVHPRLAESVCTIGAIAGHSKNNEYELERRFCGVIVSFLNEDLLIKKPKEKEYFLSKPKSLETGLTSFVLQDGFPNVRVGELVFDILWGEPDPQSPHLPTLDLYLELQLQGQEPVAQYFPFTPLVEGLHVQGDRTPIRSLEEEGSPIFIDLEWVSCYKKDPEETWVAPGQVSEYAFLWEDTSYHSGYLRVASHYTKKVRKKFLDKLEVSEATLLQRHSFGRGFIEDLQAEMLPILQHIQSQGKRPVFLYFGSEDGKILQRTFGEMLGEGEAETFLYRDVTQHYHISNFGQMALLNGLGVEFFHDFSPDMDVLALRLIYQVFSQAKTVEESLNLLVAIQFQKMVALCEMPERLEYYHDLFLSHWENQEMYHKARELGQAFREEFMPQS